jgi:hypothetical protein
MKNTYLLIAVATCACGGGFTSAAGTGLGPDGGDLLPDAGPGTAGTGGAVTGTGGSTGGHLGAGTGGKATGGATATGGTVSTGGAGVSNTGGIPTGGFGPGGAGTTGGVPGTGGAPVTGGTGGVPQGSGPCTDATECPDGSYYCTAGRCLNCFDPVAGHVACSGVTDSQGFPVLRDGGVQRVHLQTCVDGLIVYTPCPGLCDYLQPSGQAFCCGPSDPSACGN